MNGFFYFVITVCLISIGLLIGWTISAYAGKETWAALGAIGNWIGGLGAFCAAFAAIHIARTQAKEDSYRLKVEAIPSDNLRYLANAMDWGKNAFLTVAPGMNVSGEVTLEAYNAGRRPIEIVRLIYRSSVHSGVFDLHDFIVPAGRRVRKNTEFKTDIYIDGKLTAVNASFLCGCSLQVEDAAGLLHDVAVKLYDQ